MTSTREKKVEREKIIKEIQKKTKDMSATKQSFKVSLDRQEQYSYRNCLLIHDVPENRNLKIKFKFDLRLVAKG